MRTITLHGSNDKPAVASHTQSSNDAGSEPQVGGRTYLLGSIASYLLLAALLLFCSCDKEPPQPEQSGSPVSAVRSKNKVTGDYLSLDKGSWWKYRKRVPATDRQTGKDEIQHPVFSYTETDAEDIRLASTASRSQIPGDSVETYSVVSGPEATDDGYTGFEIQAKLTGKSDSPLCFVRDGRYKDAKRGVYA